MEQTPVQGTPAQQPLQAEVVSSATQAVNGKRYAGFWLRVVASIIDGIIVGVVNAIITSVMLSSSPTNNAKANAIAVVLGFLYYTYMESSESQATFGKRIMGIKVTDLEGHRITFGKAALRYISKIVSAVILLIGYIMVAFTQKKQGLHDIIAGTLVVKK